MQLLAILGRGVQQLESGGPWVLTQNLEVCDVNGAHLAIRKPIDDQDPHCLIGGGELNFRAGILLCRLYASSLKAVVCAYGHRSPYLASINAPSESEVMSEKLIYFFHETGHSHPKIVVWPRERIVEGRSNTNREIQNAFELAVEMGFTEVGIVTVSVHYARSLLIAHRHLMKPGFSHLKLQCFVSENVILAETNSFRSNEEEDMSRMHGSQAFMRTLFYEQRGINCLLAGNY